MVCGSGDVDPAPGAVFQNFSRLAQHRLVSYPTILEARATEYRNSFCCCAYCTHVFRQEAARQLAISWVNLFPLPLASIFRRCTGEMETVRGADPRTPLPTRSEVRRRLRVLSYVTGLGSCAFERGQPHCVPAISRNKVYEFCFCFFGLSRRLY